MARSNKYTKSAGMNRKMKSNINIIQYTGTRPGGLSIDASGEGIIYEHDTYHEKTYLNQSFVSYIKADTSATFEFKITLSALNVGADGLDYQIFCICNSAGNLLAQKISVWQGNLYVQIFDSTGNARIFTSTGKMSAGTHKLTVVYNRTSTFKVFMDGAVLPGTLSYTGTGISRHDSTWLIDFGCSRASAAAYRPLVNGKFIEFHYSPYIRSDADIIRRQNDLKGFKIDRYSMLAFHATSANAGGSKVRGWIYPKRMYDVYI